MDADLRRPSVAEYLGVEGAVGLTTVLIGQADLRDAIQPWGKGTLHVLPAGQVPPNPSELLGSSTMASLLEHLSSQYDIAGIDTPPLLPVTDAAILAGHPELRSISNLPRWIYLAHGCLSVGDGRQPRVMPSKFQREFVEEFLGTARACASVGRFDRLTIALNAWRATAEAYANPNLSIDGSDLEPLTRPTEVANPRTHG